MKTTFKRPGLLLCLLWSAATLCFTGCGNTGTAAPQGSSEAVSASLPASSDTPAAASETPSAGNSEAAAVSSGDPVATGSEDPGTAIGSPRLLYQGHASIRIITEDDKVIYIDPYTGDGYDRPADLILITHDHYDHTDLSKITDRAEDCQIITYKEAHPDGEYRSFDLDYVKVEAVEAGYNANHDVRNCVGYLLTFRNGACVYVSGDTSTTQQMAELSSRSIDYAFYCCDGIYNMGPEEASSCADLVNAAHSIPYHMSAADGSTGFDAAQAERFTASGRMILMPGEEIEISH